MTSTCGPATAAAARVSLRPVHQVVDQHAEPPLRPGPELGDRGGQVVHAVQRLHHHALDAQVVAPHPLDQLGVVQALHPDPGGPRGARRCGRPPVTEPDAERVGVARARGAGTTSVAGAPSNRKAAGRSGNTRRRPCRSSSVTSRASTATTAPQNPLAGSSTTSPSSAGTSGTCLRTRIRVPSAANAPR